MAGVGCQRKSDDARAQQANAGAEAGRDGRQQDHRADEKPREDVGNYEDRYRGDGRGSGEHDQRRCCPA